MLPPAQKFLWCAIVVAALGGWAFGRRLAPTIPASPPILGSQAEPVEVEQARPNRAESPDVGALIETRLSAAGKTLSQTEMTVALYDIARSLEPAEFSNAVSALAASPRRSFAGLLAGYWAEVDLPAAREWFEKLAPQAQNQSAYELFGAWSAIEPREALAWIEQLEPERREEIFYLVRSSLTERLGPLEPERTLALIGEADRSASATRDSTGRMRGSGIAALFGALAEKSPAEAAARALAMPGGSGRTEAAAGVAKAWASTDPQSARAWAEQLQDAALAAYVIPACAEGLAKRDPAKAAEWIGSLPASVANQNAMRSVMAQWSATDPERALAWLNSIPQDAAEPYVDTALSEIGRRNADRALQLVLERRAAGLPNGIFLEQIGYRLVEQKGPAEALRAATTAFHSPEDIGAENLVRGIISAATSADLRKAADWATQLASGPVRRTALATVSERMMQKDAPGAIRWTAALPRDEESDNARHQLVHSVFTQYPDGSLELYAGMTDSSEAKRCLHSSVAAWVRNQPDRALPWLEKTTAISGADKVRLRQTSSGNQ